jgi:hypothetical protein
VRIHPLLLVAVLFSISAPALAQPADSHAIAEEQFRQGREAMSRRDYKQALRFFRTSQGAEPGRGKLLNIALCEEHLGLSGSAWKHFQEVQAQLPTGDERAPIVKQHLDAVRPQVPYLKIQLAPSAPAGTTVTVDGEPLAPASLGTDIPVDPGPHVVAATAPGATEKRYDVKVVAAEHWALDVAPQAAAAVDVVVPPPTPPAQVEPAPRGLGWTLGLAAVGVGGAALVVGIGTGAAAAAKHSSTAKLCNTPSTCPAGQQSDINAYYALGNASTAMFVIGGALAATGVVLMVTSRRGEKPAADAWIAPLVGPGVLGAQGRFW